MKLQNWHILVFILIGVLLVICMCKLTLKPPDSPINITVVSKHNSAIVSFTHNTPDTFIVTSYPEHITATGNSSPITVIGLKVDVLYTFTVKSVTHRGFSKESLPSLPIPAIPTDIKIKSSDKSAFVSFLMSDHATSYTVLASDGIITIGTTSPIHVTGLTNGVFYTFTVSASNETSVSSISNPSYRVIINPIPEIPTLVSAIIVGNIFKYISVHFTKSMYADSYIVYASSDGITANGIKSPITIKNLKRGVPYTFTVKSVNSSGSSNQSIASKVVILN